MNRGQSSASDVQALIALIQDRVKAETGIELETEVLFLGETGCQEHSLDTTAMEEHA